jgi:eukaryotic-like serine/threonine-protein kinase
MSRSDRSKTRLVEERVTEEIWTMIGQTISHYKILEKLGEGGMGVVYKAEDTKLRRIVALKFLPPLFSTDDEVKQRFIHEAQAASALNHTNICSIHTIEEFEKQQFIDMEFVEGKTLSVLLKEKELSLNKVFDVAIQICEGLNAAHKKGIVHRDIKPDNIMVNDECMVKIMDFGLAKLKGSSKLTKAHSTLGTLSYMSPEQARGEDVDQRSDIWSLGVVLYEMLTRRLPFKSEYEQAVVYSILNEDPKPLSSIRFEIPHGLDTVIQKAMAKKSEERYQQVTDMEDDLKNLLKAITSPASNMRNSKTHDIPSIAVLPFKDMSPARDQEYFCEGIAEELINAFTQIDGLRVAARTSVFQYKNKESDVRKIGKELHVGAVLEGSVRKAGNRLRITAQLVNVSDGYHLWSEKYDRDLEDIFAIQDEISLAIVEKLRGKLLKEEKSKLVRRYTGNEKAYNLYLKGRYYWNRRHEGGLQKALERFQQAVEEDPSCAPGYVGIADCFDVSALLGFMDPRVASAKSKEAVAKALDIDEDLAEAHASLGWIKTFHDWDWVGAEAEFLRAFELNPNYATAHYFYALYLGVMGRYEKCAAETYRALELDPIDLVFNSIHAVMLYWGRRYDAAIEQFQKALDMDPNFYIANLYLGLALSAKRMWREALEPFERALAVSPGSPFAMGFIGYALAASGRKKEALEMLDRLEELSRERFVGAFDKAVIHLGLEADDRMFDYLERAFDEKESWLAMLNTLPLWDSVRSDTRFVALVRRVGFQR